MPRVMQAITLWQPWASWIAWGWKTIETRTHQGFRGLVGKRVAIHAGKRWDSNAIEVAAEYMIPTATPPDEWLQSARDVCGMVVCTAYVTAHGRLDYSDSRGALCDCGLNDRFGLFLSRIHLLCEPAPATGRQGIWNWEAPQ